MSATTDDNAPAPSSDAQPQLIDSTQTNSRDPVPEVAQEGQEQEETADKSDSPAPQADTDVATASAPVQAPAQQPSFDVSILSQFADKLNSFVSENGAQLEQKLQQMGEKYDRLQRMHDRLVSIRQKQQQEADLKQAQAAQQATQTIAAPVTNGHACGDTQAASSDAALVEDLRRQLDEKTKEFESHKTKVDEWKEKVKKMTQKDTQRLEVLKKALADKDEQVARQQTQHQQEKQDLENRVLQLEQQLRSESDRWKQELEKQQQVASDATAATAKQQDQLTKVVKIVERVTVGGAIWSMVELDDSSVTWLDESTLTSRLGDATLDTPDHLESRLRKEFLEQQQQESQAHETELQKLRAQLEERDEELRTYKARAAAALKKKTDSLNTIKQEHEKNVQNMLDQIQTLETRQTDLQKERDELERQLAELLDVQIRALRLSDELDAVTKERNAFEERLADTEQHLRSSLEQHKSELERLATEHEARVQELQEAHKRLDDEMRREQLASRERSRKLADEKDREIVKLQKKLNALKADLERAREAAREGLERELDELQRQRDEEESVSSQSIPIAQEFVVDSQPSPSGPSSHRGVPSTVSSGSSPATPLLPSPVQPAAQQPQSQDVESKILRSVLKSPENDDTLVSSAYFQSGPIELQKQQPSASTAAALHDDLDQFMKLAQLQASRESELQEYKRSLQQVKELLRQKEEQEKMHRQQETRLKNEVEMLQRLQKQDTPNLEYLKNIMVKFFESSHDATIQQKLFAVITTILPFTEAEKTKVRQIIDGKSTAGKSALTATPGLLSWVLPNSATSSPSK